MNTVDDVLDDDDLESEEESDLEYISSKTKKSSPEARRRVEQLMELRRLRQLLGDPDFNGFD
ncbi:PA3496 family putative envelope integrity protein [Sedimenticola hydrogenitrophicus]|uniref:PA3496 family putative envelope integrity protein n=1 Tax=Sedimenticola hydrogenitrophicus TaxID=2967975 RepID=UPI0021A6C7CC|nr:hypothetical protein [Sedimenticola hydrogenitrophicus]